MAKKKYKATLSKGRKSWCIIFRHPHCLGPDGKQKLRVRRGLGTDDKVQAQELVDQMNIILGEAAMWENPASRESAALKFDERIVAAFFDPLLPPSFNAWEIRNEEIALPGGKNTQDGYARVLFLGTTGAGKTTIVRQLIGTDPEQERFPSISAAKTTICDIELVLDEGPYRGVVTFIPRDRVRQYIAECVLAAIMREYAGDPEREVARRFFEHSEQRFRLSYLLGNQALLERQEPDELEDEEDEIEEVASDDLPLLSEEELQSLAINLKSYFSSIKAIGRSGLELQDSIAKELNIDKASASREERDAIQELVEDQLGDAEEFHALVDIILDDVESRFDFLIDGVIKKGKDGWPIKWTYTSEDRKKFIQTVNRFSSNYAPHFGRLLTPLVEGIRVSGPFKPSWHDGETPRLVLMDGQGIGHTADSTSSLSTSITRRFDTAHAIVLVDNAAQPMQAAPCAALESLLISGHEGKLIMAFTHFDEVKGDNLSGTRAKKDHVIGSFDNAVHAMGKSYGREAETALRKLVPERIVFFSVIQKKIPESAKFTRSELNRFVSIIASLTKPAAPVECQPVYDIANLVLAIQSATQEFHDKWKGILGFGSVSGVRAEHWTRVKALTRRLGVFRVDEYDNLKPVADLIRLLQTHLSRFISNPLRWNPFTPGEESDERMQSIDAIKTEVFSRLHDLSKRRVMEERVRDWMVAFEYRGIGSTRTRARDVVSIYQGAAPVPNEMPGADENQFLFELRELIAESVLTAGGELRGWERGN